MSKITHSTDVVIIGAGPVGLFAVFECGMLKMRCHVVDTLDFIGGQCTALYPEKPIYDIAGHPQIEAGELINQLEKQAAPFNPVYHLGQRVEKLEILKGEQEASQSLQPAELRANENLGKFSGRIIKITTSNGTDITCKAVIIAAGCGAFGPNRPPLEGIEQYEGKSVFYAVRRKEDLRGKRVVIAGGGDSAVDWAIALQGIASKIYLVHRRDKFRCAPENADKIKQLAASGALEMVVPYQLHSLEGVNGQISRVVVSDLNNNIKMLEADVLLLFFGLSMELGPIADWGLNLDKTHVSIQQSTCETSQSGIFAIGDIATYFGKLKLIVCGFSEAAIAAHAAYKYVHPDVALHFEYSTSKGVK